MKDLWKIATPISTAAVLIAMIWGINACVDRGEQFKIECMRAGGSVVSTASQDMCLQGVSATTRKSAP